MPQHLAEHLAAGRRIPRILVLRKNAVMGQVIEDLILIAEVADDNDYQNMIGYLPLRWGNEVDQWVEAIAELEAILGEQEL
jgi:hypothetical protein